MLFTTRARMIIMEWTVNRFLKDKWVRYYSNPKNSKKEYMLTSVVHSIILIIILWGIFLYLIFTTTSAVYILICVVVGILLTLHEVHTWIMMDYLKFSWQPIKVRISDDGLEIINLFGEYKIIRWVDIKKIEYSEGQLLWEKYKMYEAIIIPRPKPPPIIAPRKIHIGLDLEIGPKVLERWKFSQNGAGIK